MQRTSSPAVSTYPSFLSSFCMAASRSHSLRRRFLTPEKRNLHSFRQHATANAGTRSGLSVRSMSIFSGVFPSLKRCAPDVSKTVATPRFANIPAVAESPCRECCGDTSPEMPIVSLHRDAASYMNPLCAPVCFHPEIFGGVISSLSHGHSVVGERCIDAEISHYFCCHLRIWA